MSRLRVADNARGFITITDGKPFVPWGFNYDHDRDGRLLEDYWIDEWETVVEDFREMKELGANAVRIHLQFGKFMQSIDQPNETSLGQLGRLLRLAESTGIYLDLTGLGCYHKQDVPEWYDDLDESARWRAQASFWRAIARVCRDSPAVFCYDLMNEPVVPGGKRGSGEWLGPPFANKHFVQFVTLDQGQRPRPAIARDWVRHLSRAIREVDPRHLITVGLVDWSLNRPGLTSGFEPPMIAPEVDFLCVHIYPESGKVATALETLKGFDCGKPVVIEETFTLKCSLAEFREFIEGSKEFCGGWMGFYWGKTPAECRNSKSIADAILGQWLDYFQSRARMENPVK